MQARAYFIVASAFVAAVCVKTSEIFPDLAADNKSTSSNNRNASQSQQAYNESSNECFKIIKSMEVLSLLKNTIIHTNVQKWSLCDGDVRGDIMARLKNSIKKCDNESCSDITYIGICPCRNAAKCEGSHDFEKTPCLSTNLFEILATSNEVPMPTTPDGASFNSTTDSVLEEYDQLAHPSDNDQADSDYEYDFEALPDTTARRATTNPTPIAPNLHSSPASTENFDKPISTNDTNVPETRPVEDTSTPIQQTSVTEETSTLSPCFSYSVAATNEASTAEYAISRSTTAGTKSVATEELLHSTSDAVPETSNIRSSEPRSSLKETKSSQSTSHLPGSITTPSTHDITVSINYESEKIPISESLTTNIIPQTLDRSTHLPTSTSMSPSPTSKKQHMTKEMDTSGTQRSTLSLRSKSSISALKYTAKRSTKLNTSKNHTSQFPSSSGETERSDTSPFSKSDFGNSNDASTPTSSKQIISESTTLSKDAFTISEMAMPEERTANTWSNSLSTGTATTSAESQSPKTLTSRRIFDFTSSGWTTTSQHTTPTPSTEVNGMSSASSTKVVATKSTPSNIMSSLRLSPREPLISESPASFTSTTAWYQSGEKKSITADSRSDGTSEYVTISAESSSPLVPNASFPTTIADSHSDRSTTVGTTVRTTSQDSAQTLSTKHLKDTSKSVVNPAQTISNFATSRQLTDKAPTSDATDTKIKAREVLSTMESTKSNSSSMTTPKVIHDITSLPSESSEDETESETASIASTTKGKSASTSTAYHETLETTPISAVNSTTFTQLPTKVISNTSTTSPAVSVTVQDETVTKTDTYTTSSIKSESSSTSSVHSTTTLPSVALTMQTSRTLTTNTVKPSTNRAEPDLVPTLSTVSESPQPEKEGETFFDKLNTVQVIAKEPLSTTTEKLLPTFMTVSPVTKSRFIITTKRASTTLPSTGLTMKTSTTLTTNTVRPSTIRAEAELVSSRSTISDSPQSEKERETLFDNQNTVQVNANEPLPTTTEKLFPTFMTILPVTETRFTSTIANGFESSQYEKLQIPGRAMQPPTKSEITTFEIRMPTESKQISPKTVPEQTSSANEKGFHEPSSTRSMTTADIFKGGSTSKEKDKNETAPLSTATAIEAPTSLLTTIVLGVGSISTSSETKGLSSNSISIATRFKYGSSDIVHKDADNSFSSTKRVPTRETLVDATLSISLKNATFVAQTSRYWYELSSKKGITTGYLSFKSSLESRTNRTEQQHPSPTIIWPLRQSTTGEAKSDIFNKSADFTDSHDTSSSQSTVELSRHEGFLSTDEHTTLKQWTTSTVMTSSLRECQNSCPSKYQEGPYFCYRILSAKESTTYRRALKSCQGEDGELADEVDFRNAEVMETLEQIASENNAGSAKIYVNERGSELITKKEQVRLITLKGTTRFFLNVVGSAGMNEVLTDVYGVCRRKKNCEDIHCHLNDYDTLGISSYLVMPRIRSKMLVGEKLQIPCAKGESKFVAVTCGEKGALEPQEISSICGEDQNSSSIEWEAETSLISAELKSCSDCHVLGTNNCQRVNGSYSCVCKPEWSGHTCWKSPDQCRLKDVQCGAVGTCISAIDKAYCECYEGFSGEQCDVMNPELSFYSKTKSSILSAANAGVLVVSAGEISMMIVKGLMKLHFPKSGEDTQVFCQNMRSLLLSIAGFIVLFFHHPALFNINAFACSAWLYLETACYSLSIGFFTLESQNVHEVVHGNARKSQFWDRENKTPYEAPPVAINSVVMGLILGIGIAITTAAQMSKVVTSWSCMGHFSQRTLNVWLPVVIFNTCAALTATCFAYKSYFILTKIPQYRHKTNTYLETKELDVKSCIEKCYRNVAFVALGPWLLLATWITLALSFDWVTVGSINLTAMIVSFLYTACNFLQSAFTNPNLYSKYVRLAMKFCPRTIAPQIDPVTMWTRDEVLKNGDAKNFIPSPIKDRLRILWMQTYAKTKIEEGCSKSEALYRVYVNQMGNIASDANLEQAEQIRHMNQKWAARTHRKDPQPDPARRTKYEAEVGVPRRIDVTCIDASMVCDVNSARDPNLNKIFAYSGTYVKLKCMDYHQGWWLLSALTTEINMLHGRMLDRLTRKLCDAWNGTQALKKTTLRSADEHNKFLNALKSYLEANDYDPFEYCPLTMVDGQGNTKAIKCLKKPAETIDPAVLDRIQCQLRANIDDVHKRNERDHDHQQFDPQWLLLSDQEKKLKRLQDYEDDVWNMAKQNYDYMSRVKAL